MIAALGTGRLPEIVDRVLAQFPRLEPIADRAGGILSGGEKDDLKSKLILTLKGSDLRSHR